MKRGRKRIWVLYGNDEIYCTVTVTVSHHVIMASNLAADSLVRLLLLARDDEVSLHIHPRLRYQDFRKTRPRCPCHFKTSASRHLAWAWSVFLFPPGL
jgi:hypothetical protein